MKGLTPVFAVVAKLNRRFGGGKPSASAVHGFYAAGIESLHGLLDRAQVRMQQTNERPAKQKVKSAKCDEGCRIVEHGSGGFLHQSPLFQQAVFHHVAQALALLDFFEDPVQRRAPFQLRYTRIAQRRLQDSRDVIESNILAIELLRSA